MTDPEPGAKKKKAKKKKPGVRIQRAALERWWNRGPWPCVLLCADPGLISGGVIIVSRPGGLVLREAKEIHVLEDRALEGVIECGIAVSKQTRLPLIGVLEDWGSGGPRGLSQWIGLGEKRGVWRREMILRARDHGIKIVEVAQSVWRGRVLDQTGAHELDEETGLEKWRPFEPKEWKDLAHRSALDYFMDAWVPPLDSSEAACMGVYAARSDEVLRALGNRYLKQQGFTSEDLEELEPMITGRRAKAPKKI